MPRSIRIAAKRFLLPVLFCAVLLCALAVRADAAVSAQLRPDMTIIIDGAVQTFYNAQGQEVHPILCDGTTYLPVRAIGEVMGKNVDWNESKKTVTLSGTRTAAPAAGTPDAAAKVQTISADIRSDFTIVVDGTVRVFKDAAGSRVYPMLYNGSTYLPLRAIGGLMGKSVAWDGKTMTVTLTSPSDSLVTDADSFSGGTATAPGLITLEAAKSAALGHAGLTAEQVTFSKQKLEKDGGRQIYDIEFSAAGGQKYDYEIDAATGAVLEFDYEANTAPAAGAGGSGVINQDKAKSIALKKVPGAADKHVTKVTLDRDGGRQSYEVEIRYNGMEYEIEIDALDGTVLHMDMEADD